MHESVRLIESASAGLALGSVERLNWFCRFLVELRKGDWTAEQIAAGLAPEPYERADWIGNLLTGAGSGGFFSALCTSGLATPFTTANAQIAVGDGSTAATVADADLGAATGTTVAISAATNASPIVLTTATQSWTAGMVVVVSGVLGNTAANGTWELSAATSTTATLLNSTGNGAYTSGGTAGPVNKYRQACSAVTVGPAVGGGITNVTGTTTVTVTTTNAHNLLTGMIVTTASIGGITNCNGTFKVASVPTATTFTFAPYTTASGSYTSGGTVTLTGGASFASTFAAANANFSWAEWAITTGGGATNKQATPPPTLLNHAIPGSPLITKSAAATATATMLLGLS